MWCSVIKQLTRRDQDANFFWSQWNPLTLRLIWTRHKASINFISPVTVLLVVHLLYGHALSRATSGLHMQGTEQLPGLPALSRNRYSKCKLLDSQAHSQEAGRCRLFRRCGAADWAAELAHILHYHHCLTAPHLILYTCLTFPPPLSGACARPIRRAWQN